MKRLIINPKKEEIVKEAEILNFNTVFQTLMAKVFQSSEPDTFKPLVTKDGNIKRFISNVHPVTVAIQDYAGKEIKTYEEGAKFLQTIGAKIYKEQSWTYRLVINEVKYSRGKEFVMEIDNDEVAAKIQDGLDGIAKVEYNKIKKPKQNRKAAAELASKNTTQEQEIPNE
jgi:hypothetical protein